jgi:hypothetical protein
MRRVLNKRQPDFKMAFSEIKGGTPYEKYSKQVYEKILEKQGAKFRDCRHNIRLLGASGVRHQIDVYFEMEVDGVWKKFAIECKNYASRIEVGRVRDFWGAIADIGDINGIFIAKSGYQIGARKFAEHKAISLKELRLPQTRDWDERVKSITMDIIVLDVKVISRKFKIDEDWVKLNKIQITTQFVSTDKVFLDESLTPVASVQDVEKEIYRPKDRPVGKETYEFDISNYYMMARGEFAFKMKTLNSEVQVNEPFIETLRVEREVDCVLKDIQSGNIDFITND